MSPQSQPHAPRASRLRLVPKGEEAQRRWLVWAIAVYRWHILPYADFPNADIAERMNRLAIPRYQGTGRWKAYDIQRLVDELVRRKADFFMCWVQTPMYRSRLDNGELDPPNVTIRRRVQELTKGADN